MRCVSVTVPYSALYRTAYTHSPAAWPAAPPQRPPCAAASWRRPSMIKWSPPAPAFWMRASSRLTHESRLPAVVAATSTTDSTKKISKYEYCTWVLLGVLSTSELAGPLDDEVPTPARRAWVAGRSIVADPAWEGGSGLGGEERHASAAPRGEGDTAAARSGETEATAASQGERHAASAGSGQTEATAARLDGVRLASCVEAEAAAARRSQDNTATAGRAQDDATTAGRAQDDTAAAGSGETEATAASQGERRAASAGRGQAEATAAHLDGVRLASCVEAEAAAAVQGGPASASAGTTSPVRTSSGCTAATTSDALGRNSASWG